MSSWYVIHFIYAVSLVTFVKGAWDDFNKAARIMYEAATSGLDKDGMQDLMARWASDIGNDESMERVPLEVRMRKAAHEANRAVCIH